MIREELLKTQKGLKLKNHIHVDGQLLQTNKTWSHLKERQKSWIAELLREEYMRRAQELGRNPKKDDYEAIVEIVYDQIERRGIWIPYNEVRRYFSSRVNRYRNSLELNRVAGEVNEKEN